MKRYRVKPVNESEQVIVTMKTPNVSVLSALREIAIEYPETVKIDVLDDAKRLKQMTRREIVRENLYDEVVRRTKGWRPTVEEVVYAMYSSNDARIIQKMLNASEEAQVALGTKLPFVRLVLLDNGKGIEEYASRFNMENLDIDEPLLGSNSMTLAKLAYNLNKRIALGALVNDLGASTTFFTVYV